MQLLVSVRSAEEARAALAGGAAIIDAKEPAMGALGAVSREVLSEIRATVPDQVPLSAALGDVRSDAEVVASLSRVGVPLDFVKLGFSGVPQPAEVERLLAVAVKLAGSLPGCPRVIAVAYADWRATGSLSPDAFPDLIIRAGGHGLLIDTAIKASGRLSDFLSVDQLAAIGERLKARSLEYAVAGSLTIADIPFALATGADIIGVRGAACGGGRNGSVSSPLVSELAARVRSRAAESPPVVQSLR